MSLHPDPLVGDFIRAYEEADLQRRAERAERAAWLARLGWPESGWAFFGDYGVIAPWTELRQTFIDGSFVATILVGQAFLENALAGLLDWGDEQVERAALAGVLKQTRDGGWITPHEFVMLDKVRRMRNPYAHYRNLQHHDSLLSRAIDADEVPEVLLEQDARSVIQALYHLVNRPPFGLGPIVYPEDEEPNVHPDQMYLTL